MTCHSKPSSNDSNDKDPTNYCYTSVDSYTFTTPVARASQVFAICVLLLLCLAGNGLMIYAVFSTRSRGSMLSASSLLLVNLATADLLLGTLVLPMWVVSTVTLSWPLPEMLCGLTAFVTVTLMVCSILSLSAIAVDRCLNLTYPLRYPSEVTPQRLAVGLVSLWALCLLVAGLPLGGWGMYRFQPQTVPICNPVWVTEVSFALFLMLGGLTLPFLVMLAAYVRIVQIARRHIARIEATTAPAISVGWIPDPQDDQDDVARRGGGGGVKVEAKPVVVGGGGRLRDAPGLDDSSRRGGIKVKATRLVDTSLRLDGEMETTRGVAMSSGENHPSVQRSGVSTDQEEKQLGGSPCGDVKTGTSVFQPPKVRVTSQVVTLTKTAVADLCTYSSPTSRPEALRTTPAATSNVPLHPGSVATSPDSGVMSQEHPASSLGVKSYLSPRTATSLVTERSARRSPSFSGFASKRVFSKSVKMANRVFVAVGLFFLCWGPYVTLNLWSVNNEQSPVPYSADLLTTLLAFSNAAINPVLFLLINRDYRRTVRALGRKCVKRCWPHRKRGVHHDPVRALGNSRSVFLTESGGGCHGGGGGGGRGMSSYWGGGSRALGASEGCNEDRGGHSVTDAEVTTRDERRWLNTGGRAVAGAAPVVRSAW